MPNFPGFVLTADGENLKAKCEGSGEPLAFTAVKIGSGELPPGNAPFAATADAGTVTVYSQETGAATDAADGDAGVTATVTTQGAAGVAEVTEIVCPAASELSGGEYFTLHTPLLDYHVYFTVAGIGSDPRPAGSIPIVVDVDSLDSAVVVAEAVAEAVDHARIDGSDLVRLISYQIDASIEATASCVGDGTSKLPITFTNAGLETGFNCREIGVFATDPDLGEILYSYTNAGDGGDPMPAAGGATAVEYDLNIYTKIGTITEVSAVTVPSSTYPTLTQFNSHLADKTAHGETWSIKTADYTAVAGDKLLIDTETPVAAVSVTLPDDPFENNRVDFADYAKTWDQYKITVKRATSGEPIQGVDEDMDVELRGAAFALVYTDTEKGWVIV